MKRSCSKAGTSMAAALFALGVASCDNSTTNHHYPEGFDGVGQLDLPEVGDTVNLFLSSGESTRFLKVESIDLPNIRFESHGAKIVIDWRHVIGWMGGKDYEPPNQFGEFAEMIKTIEGR
jgi:hypothetical protein